MGGEIAQPPKPSRSDEIGTLEEQERVREEVQKLMEEAAPKRAHKPSRSEFEDASLDFEVPSDIPELHRFEELEAHSEPLQMNGPGVVSGDDYVENDYYKDLDAIGKEHYTTGTGFIKMDNQGSNQGFHLAPDYGESAFKTKNKSNPAMNDWVPAPEVTFPLSSKPARSESLQGLL